MAPASIKDEEYIYILEDCFANIKVDCLFWQVWPGPQPGLQVASSVREAPEAAGKRGDVPERRRASAGHLVSSGTQEWENTQKQKKQKGEKSFVWTNITT